MQEAFSPSFVHLLNTSPGFLFLSNKSKDQGSGCATARSGMHHYLYRMYCGLPPTSCAVTMGLFPCFWEGRRSMFARCNQSEDTIFGKMKKWRLKQLFIMRTLKNEVKQKWGRLSVKIPKSILAGESPDNTHNRHRSTVEWISNQYLHPRSKVNVLATHQTLWS